MPAQLPWENFDPTNPLDYASAALGTMALPGDYLRGVLGGRPGDRLSGEELGNQWGMLDPNSHGLGHTLGGMGLGMATDPLTLLPLLGMAAKGMSALGGAGEAASAAKVLPGMGKPLMGSLAPAAARPMMGSLAELPAASEAANTANILKNIRPGASSMELGGAGKVFDASQPQNYQKLQQMWSAHEADALKEVAAAGIDPAKLAGQHVPEEMWDSLGVRSPKSRILDDLRAGGHEHMVGPGGTQHPLTTNMPFGPAGAAMKGNPAANPADFDKFMNLPNRLPPAAQEWPAGFTEPVSNYPAAQMPTLPGMGGSQAAGAEMPNVGGAIGQPTVPPPPPQWQPPMPGIGREMGQMAPYQSQGMPTLPGAQPFQMPQGTNDPRQLFQQIVSSDPRTLSALQQHTSPQLFAYLMQQARGGW